MIVNEKALLRKLKEAYKGDGYHVAAFAGDGVEWIALMTADWLVTMERKNVPGKVRGFVAETAGNWPDLNEAYKVSRDNYDRADLNRLLEHMESVRTIFNPNYEERAKPTGLILGQTEIWQGCTTLDMLLMDPGLTGIIGSSRTPVYKMGNVLRATGEISTLYLYATTPNEATASKLKHLKQVRWVQEA